MENKVFHCIDVQQFDYDYLEEICDLADKIREISRTKAGMEYLASTLNHKRAMLYFVQPSTRTFLSFYSACQMLGIKCAEVRDPRPRLKLKANPKKTRSVLFHSFLI